MAVRIYLEIGHEASIRTKKTQEGFTHDWEVFVRGCDGAEIHYYVEKVVFYLHDTFPKPKRVVKEPPYSVKESGYAGFNLPIDIYLRNNSEPKKIRFNYDLHLQQSGPPIIKVQKEKYVFNSSSEEFRMKLMKGGALVGSSSSIQDSNDSRSSFDDKNQMTNKPKLSGSDLVKKQKIKPIGECRDFQELFGSPINMSKTSDQKISSKQENKSADKPRTKPSPHKDSHKDKEKKEKSEDKKSRDEKKQKEKSKDRERSKDKNVKREKSPKPKSPSPKRSPKRSSPSRFSSPPVIKHKESKQYDKEKDKREKSDEKKSKKERRKEHKENKHEEQKSEEHKEAKVKNELKKEESKTKEIVSPPHKYIEKEKKEKTSREKSSKEEKHAEKYKHKKKDKEKREKKEEKSHKSEKKEKIPEPKPNLFKTEPPKKEKINYSSPVVPNLDDESSNSSISSSNSSIVEQKFKPEVMKVKEEKIQKPKKEKSFQETAIKCKRKSDSIEKEEPPEKIHKEHGINNNSDKEQESKNVIGAAPAGLEADYFSVLRDLQHKIMALKDNADLQKVVQLIAETGRYEVSAHTFDFDLCLLDRSTVKQLQEFFASET